jgi:hypothetical protein
MPALHLTGKFNQEDAIIDCQPCQKNRAQHGNLIQGGVEDDDAPDAANAGKGEGGEDNYRGDEGIKEECHDEEDGKDGKEAAPVFSWRPRLRRRLWTLPGCGARSQGVLGYADGRERCQEAVLG